MTPTEAPPRAWIDITLPIAPGSIAWVGLAPPRLSFVAEIAAGAAVNVGQLDCSLHTGTHADAPLHVLAGGASVDRLDPAIYIGPALIVRTEDESAITRDALAAAGLGARRTAGDPPLERLLVATPRPYDGVHFPDRIAHLTPDAATWLAGLGLRLIGVDVPSLDPLDSRTMDAHKIVFGAGMGVLENLDLRGVAPGCYELVAVPIRIAGADAAPVRALIRPLVQPLR
jgi:arylformamidase